MRDFVLTLPLFSAIAVVTVLLAGSFASNLLHDIYVGRRRQYATLMALGFSPATGIAPAVVFGLALGLAAAGIGGLVSSILVPRSFAMPSLMADLGPTEPTFDWLVAGAIVAIASPPSWLAWSRRSFGSCGSPLHLPYRRSLVSQPLVFVRSVSKTYRRERATVDALSDVSLEVGKESSCG